MCCAFAKESSGVGARYRAQRGSLVVGVAALRALEAFGAHGSRVVVRAFVTLVAVEAGGVVPSRA